jgi:GMP synthase (glutamine-hydrolysing)
MAHALGGAVESGHIKEYGHAQLEIDGDGGPMLEGLPRTFSVWMSHGDEVTQLPDGFRVVAHSSSCSIAAMVNEEKRLFGVQFHLEVTHTEHGLEMLRRFVTLCRPAPWSVGSFAAHVGEQVKKEVGGRKVFMLVSGGVDSTVAFTLLDRVIGPERVYGMLVDTGLMRKGEIVQIQSALHALGYNNLHVEDASDQFFAALKGVVDPEHKRQIIGQTFLEVQRTVAQRLALHPPAWMLGQGTIYPDTIESKGTKHADHIKTHHNRVAEIQEMIEQGLVCEPLKELYKDEVRKLGEELGLPHDLVWRHPFPGPGLGVRVLCSDGVAVEEVGVPLDVPHVVLPIRSVGVQGDGRTYRRALALFVPERYPHEAHWRMATEIPNRHAAINRVLLCTSHSEPVALVASAMDLSRVRADLLREADAIVDEEMRAAGLYSIIWQFPVVLLPVGIQSGGQSIVLRPVESTEAMTANAARLPAEAVQRMTKRIVSLTGIDCVFVDLTSKPPGTIEWE